MILEILAFSCPLLLASLGALYTEYTGSLALYLEGLISFSAFLMYLFTTLTGSYILASILCTTLVTLIITLFAIILTKTRANIFVSSIALNLFFAGFTTFLSALIFNTRGTLSSPEFFFSKNLAANYSIIITTAMTALGGFILFFTQAGIYFRTTGTESNVLKIKGVNPSIYKISSWAISGLFAAQTGVILSMRISSFVPNISSGRGWMALAAVYLGRKKLWKVILFVLIFCAADYISANLQNFWPGTPNSLILALPYLTVLLLSFI